MEEFIGKIWHGFISKAASQEYPEARVTLDEVRKLSGIVFRALGGDGNLQIKNSYNSKTRRGILQRIAGDREFVKTAWRDADHLLLPEYIAIFPDKKLNYYLYIWLSALATIDRAENLDWITVNRKQTLDLLSKYPGLKGYYDVLVTAYLKQCRVDNELIKQALLYPDQETPASKDIEAVPLWLHPNSKEDKKVVEAKGEAEGKAETKDEIKQDKKRRKAEREEMPDGKSGLLSFRLESFFSWTEYVKVDRTTDETDDDPIRTADDMDCITVARDDQSIASKVRFDLDLPSSEYDDVYLGDGIPLPEWDFKQQLLLPDHCRLQMMLPRQEVLEADLPDNLRAAASKLRRQFEMLNPHKVWLNRQDDGTELDIDSYIANVSERQQGQLSVYRNYRNIERDLSCLLLADLSLSTDTWVNNKARVIDIIRDSLFLFAEALSATQDRFSLYGFSSRNRNHIRFYQLKSFAETYNAKIRARISSIKPGYYTRMGAAIRRSSEILVKQASKQKLLLILTDGKPNDLDKYESRYGIEDTKQALHEARQLGLKPFCVTIDKEAEDYLPMLFGHKSFVVIRNIEELPRKLALLYVKLT
jgi:nitric oxide reductase NorD protein